MSKQRKGRDGRANKRLACAVCGLPWLRDKMELWVMQIHFELWHDTDKIDLIIKENNTPLDVPEPIDMATSQEILQTLDKLAAAVTEAKTATAEAHTATRDLKHTLKETLRDCRDEIENEIRQQVGAISGNVETDMKAAVVGVIDRLEADLRAKLSLT